MTIDWISLVTGGIGTTVSMSLYLSQTPGFVRAWNNKDTTEISYYFAFIAFLCQISWLLYGIRIGAHTIIISSTLCATIIFGFLVVYHIISRDFVTSMIKYVCIVATMLLFSFRYFAKSDLGGMALIFNFLTYAAPMEQLANVFAEKSERYIDINVLCMCLISCLAWGAFGFLEQDAFIAIPNVVGLVFVVFQMMAYLWATGRLPNAFCCLCTKICKQEEEAGFKKPSLKV